MVVANSLLLQLVIEQNAKSARFMPHPLNLVESQKKQL